MQVLALPLTRKGEPGGLPREDTWAGGDDKGMMLSHPLSV